MNSIILFLSIHKFSVILNIKELVRVTVIYPVDSDLFSGQWLIQRIVLNTLDTTGLWMNCCWRHLASQQPWVEIVFRSKWTEYHPTLDSEENSSQIVETSVIVLCRTAFTRMMTLDKPFSFIWLAHSSIIKTKEKLEIGHFRDPFASVSKWVQVRNLSYQNQFHSNAHSNANQTHFHMKGFAWDLFWNRGRRQLGNGLLFHHYRYHASFSLSTLLREQPW